MIQYAKAKALLESLKTIPDYRVDIGKIEYPLHKENIAIDGKWLNGSDVNGQYTNEYHKAILNILDKDKKIVFAHKFMAKNKENEITGLKQAYKEPYSIAILRSFAINLL